MTDYYTHGSISNVKIKSKELLLKIKPLNELEIIINDEKCTILVPVNPAGVFVQPGCEYVSQNMDFDATGISLISSMLSYWLQNKTKLKFNVSKDKTDEAKLTIISIESLNDDKN